MATEATPEVCVNGIREDNEDLPEDMTRKRGRSSGSFTDESGEASPKKTKVDSSFELSEKVSLIANNRGDNGVLEDQKMANSVCKVADTGGGVTKVPEERKTIIKQVEQLARDREMTTDFRFEKPPGFKYNLGHKSVPGEYVVYLVLLNSGESDPAHKFRGDSGEAGKPYEAMRAAAMKALEFLSGEEKSSVSQNNDVISSSTSTSNEVQAHCSKVNSKTESPKKPIDREKLLVNDDQESKDHELNGVNEDDMDDKSSINSDDDSDGPVEENKVKSERYTVSLRNFWNKAMKTKFPSVNVVYSVKEEVAKDFEDEVVVECAIGKLVVEGFGKDEVEAQDSSAQHMFTLIEDIIQNEGAESLTKSIIDGEDAEEAYDGQMNGESDHRDEVEDVETIEEHEEIVEDHDEVIDDCEDIEDDDEVYPEHSSELPPHLVGSGYQEIGQHQNYQQLRQQRQQIHQMSRHVTPPSKSELGPGNFGSGCGPVPGHEYALSLTDLTQNGEPQILDLNNLPRRTKFPMMAMIARSEADTEMSDDEDVEGGRILAVFQEMLSMVSIRRLGHRHRQQISEMMTRAGLISPPSMYQQPQLSGIYPQMFGGPSTSGYPHHQQPARVQQPPPKPAPPPKPTPINTLCKFPDPPIEGVGAVTVTREDYKTLQVGTFLNDVIIDYYLKWLQYTKFSEKDKNGVHIFTTFWFSKLTSKPSPIEARKDPVQRRHDRVKRWTRKVNIFEKDFVVVPINENYHWYLCIICYPGMVGCQKVEDNSSCPQPKSQKSRRKKKDLIKGIKASMNARSRKNEDDERDEPLASEDEVEHEDDSLDVDLWRQKKVAWDEAMEKRRQLEEERRQEMERQRLEWEERKRLWEIEERKKMEEQARQLEEQVRREEGERMQRLEEEEDEDELGDEEENWDDLGVKCDEEGNPVVDSRTSDDEMDIGNYVKENNVNKGFADAANYKFKSSIEENNITVSAKTKEMEDDWDDWGEEEDMNQDQVMTTDNKKKENKNTVSNDYFITSLVAHRANSTATKSVTSGANKVTFKQSPDFLTMTAHKTSKYVLDQIISYTIPQVDGIVDDEEAEKDEKKSSCDGCKDENKKSSDENEMDHESEKAQNKSSDESEVKKDDSKKNESSDERNKGENNSEEMESISCNTSKDSGEVTFKSGSLVGLVSLSYDTSDTEVDEADNSNQEFNPPNYDKVVNTDINATIDTMSVGEGEEIQINQNESSIPTEATAEEQSPKPEDKSPEVDLKSEDVDNQDFDGDESSEECDHPMEIGNQSPEVGNQSPEIGNQSPELGDESPEFGYQSPDNHRSPVGSDTEPNSSGSETENRSAVNDTRKEESDSEIEELEMIEDDSLPEKRHEEESDSDENEEDIYGSENDDEDEDLDDDHGHHIPVRQPCILVFDSLGGKKDRQARLCQTLRDFLTKEYEEKYPGQTREFSTKTIPGSAPKVQQQPNLTDCGLYLCQNTEAFFKYPVPDFSLPITSLHKWFPESEVRYKRRDVAGLIRKMATEQNPDKLDQLQFPDLVFVEPERQEVRREERVSGGSDGEGGDDYNSDDDLDDRDFQEDRDDRDDHDERDDRDDQGSYQSSPVDVQESRYEEQFSSSSDEDKGDERRNKKRYRSDDSVASSSGSRDSRHGMSRRRKKDKRDSSSNNSDGSDDDFDSRAIYGNSSVAGRNDSEKIRSLPPGISVTRTSPDKPNNIKQMLAKRLPPGISFSSTSDKRREANKHEVDVSSEDESIMDVSDGEDIIAVEEYVPACPDKKVTETFFASVEHVAGKYFASYENVSEKCYASVEHISDTKDLGMSSYFPSMVSHTITNRFMTYPCASILCHRVISYDVETEASESDDTMAQVDGTVDMESDNENDLPDNENVMPDNSNESATNDESGNNDEEVDQPAEEINENKIASEGAIPGIDAEDFDDQNEQHAEGEVLVENEQDPFIDESLDINAVAEDDLTDNHEFSGQYQDESMNFNDDNAEGLELGQSDDEPINQDVIPGAEFTSDVFDDTDPQNEPEEVEDDQDDIQMAEEELSDVANDAGIVKPASEAPWRSEVIEDDYQSEDYEEGEDDLYEEEENYDYNAYQEPEGISPSKRARNEQEDEEVVLDSDEDEDDDGVPQEEDNSMNQMSEHARWQNQMRSQQGRQPDVIRGSHPSSAVDSRILAQQIMYQQQQQARSMYQPTQNNQQQPPRPGQKRKRPSMALCIKDSRVYVKPFSELPSSVFNHNIKPQQIPANPYKPVPNLYQQSGMFNQQLTVQQMTVQQKKPESSQQVQDRLKSLLPGLDIKQAAGVTSRREKPEYDVVEEDEDDDDDESLNTDDKSEYDSEDDDVGINDIRANQSGRVVESINQLEEDFLEEKEDIIGMEDNSSIDHSEPVELNESNELSGDILTFEQSGKDVQEAYEEHEGGHDEGTAEENNVDSDVPEEENQESLENQTAVNTSSQ